MESRILSVSITAGLLLCLCFAAVASGTATTTANLCATAGAASLDGAWPDGATVGTYGIAGGLTTGVSVHATSGTILFTNEAAHVIRALHPNGTVDVIAGSQGTASSVDAANPLDARFSSPSGVAVDYARGVLYVAAAGEHKVRSVALVAGGAGGAGAVATLAGSGTAGAGDAAAALAATLDTPDAVAVDGARDVLFVVERAARVRRVALPGAGATAGGAVVTLAFTPSVVAAPVAVAYDPQGDALFVALGGGGVARAAAPGAGDGSAALAAATVSGAGPSAVYEGLAGDWARGVVYAIEPAANVVVSFAADGSGTVTDVAGKRGSSNSIDGPAGSSSKFTTLLSIAFDSYSGGLVVGQDATRKLRFVANVSEPCAMLPPPTTAPTVAPPAPTPAPTVAPPAPTPAPTVAPPAPTAAPTVAPPAPTPAPTVAPPAPTPAPTVAPPAPTAAPTVAPSTPTGETHTQTSVQPPNPTATSVATTIAAPTAAPSAATPAPTATRTTLSGRLGGAHWVAVLAARRDAIAAALARDLAGAFDVDTNRVDVQRLAVGSLVFEAAVTHDRAAEPGGESNASTAAVAAAGFGNVTAAYASTDDGAGGAPPDDANAVRLLTVTASDVIVVLEPQPAVDPPGGERQRTGVFAQCDTPCVVIIAASVSGIVAAVVGALVFVLTRSKSGGGAGAYERAATNEGGAGGEAADAASLVPERFSVVKRLSLSGSLDGSAGGVARFRAGSLGAAGRAARRRKRLASSGDAEFDFTGGALDDAGADAGFEGDGATRRVRFALQRNVVVAYTVGDAVSSEAGLPYAMSPAGAELKPLIGPAGRPPTPTAVFGSQPRASRPVVQFPDRQQRWASDTLCPDVMALDDAADAPARVVVRVATAADGE